ncbi:hypothetical protein [Nocardia sp. NPDC005366]|uniref:hypothetical protein n=1 Tax=Nocardia sp. NPDC005366 TaxID=3156878 RepID=UPI0033BDC70B
MTGPRDSHSGDGFGEFAEELKLLAETVLERVEPVLRHAADQPGEWSSCSWCPVCAAAALMRGEHHEVVAAIADHGTAIVTVLREALAGAPVEPVPPDAESEGVAPHPHSHRHADDAESNGAESNGAESNGTESDDAVDRRAPDRPRAAARKHGESFDTAGRARSRYVSIPVTIKA